MKLLKVCECGCGKEFHASKKSVRFIKGHKIVNHVELKEKFCNKCNDKKSVDNFEIITHNHKYSNEQYIKYANYCNDCKSLTLSNRMARTKEQRKITKQKYKNIHKTEPRFHIQEKISYWKSKYKIPSNLTVDYLVKLFEQQNKKCYYSGDEIFFGFTGVKPNSASLDRKNPELGYVQGNIVWCSYFVNTMKGNLPEKDFISLINKIVSYHERKIS
jgi:hypothetical protein